MKPLISRRTWIIAFILGGLSAYLVSLQGFITFYTTPILYTLNPWYFLLEPLGIRPAGGLYYLVSSIVGIFVSLRDPEFVNAIGNPAFFFLTHLLLWRSLFYITARKSLEDEVRLREKRTLKWIMLSLFLIFPIVSGTDFGFKYYNLIEEKKSVAATQNLNEIFRTMRDGKANKNSCDNADENKWGVKSQHCPFVLALTLKDADVCKMIFNADAKYLCQDFVQRVKNNSLTRNACDDLLLNVQIAEGVFYSANTVERCNEFLGIYLQDLTTCEKGYREICFPYIFSR